MPDATPVENSQPEQPKSEDLREGAGQPGHPRARQGAARDHEPDRRLTDERVDDGAHAPSEARASRLHEDGQQAPRPARQGRAGGPRPARQGPPTQT